MNVITTCLQQKNIIVRNVEVENEDDPTSLSFDWVISIVHISSPWALTGNLLYKSCEGSAMNGRQTFKNKPSREMVVYAYLRLSSTDDKDCASFGEFAAGNVCLCKL